MWLVGRCRLAVGREWEHLGDRQLALAQLQLLPRIRACQHSHAGMTGSGDHRPARAVASETVRESGANSTKKAKRPDFCVGRMGPYRIGTTLYDCIMAWMVAGSRFVLSEEKRARARGARQRKREVVVNRAE